MTRVEEALARLERAVARLETAAVGRPADASRDPELREIAARVDAALATIGAALAKEG